MQACRGGGCTAEFFGVNGLVSFRILQLSPDIRGQRHSAESLQDFKENAFIQKPHDPVPARGSFLHDGLKLSIAEKNVLARLCFSAGAGETLPAIIAEIPKKNKLDSTARRPCPDEPRREDTGIVENKAVPFPQEIRKIVEMPMLHAAGVFIQTEQAGFVPLFQRCLGDKFFG